MKKLTAKVSKKYTIDDPIKYSNNTLYYYFDLEGNYLYNVGDFGKSMVQDKVTEAQLLKKYLKINIDYKVEFCNGTVIPFIKDKNEAISMAKGWTDLNLLKSNKKYISVFDTNGYFVEYKEVKNDKNKRINQTL